MRSKRRRYLVIDDLHELQSDQALAWLDRLSDRRPPELSMVLASRQDPRLGLHRLRLTGELIELRQAPHLRFSLWEFPCTKEIRISARFVTPCSDIHSKPTMIRGTRVTA